MLARFLGPGKNQFDEKFEPTKAVEVNGEDAYEREGKRYNLRSTRGPSPPALYYQFSDGNDLSGIVLVVAGVFYLATCEPASVTKE